MSLPLPNLDNRTYEQLLEEARSLIPSQYARWTNHNPSDPGIILMEMLVWLTEMLLYRVDQVPDSNVEVFLKLLNGPDWQRTGDLDAAIRETILDLRQRYRAASCEDFQQLVLVDWHQTEEAKNLGAAGKVARVKCLKERNLAAGTPSARAETVPGHVSLVVLPQRPQPEADNPVPIPENVLNFDGVDDYLELPAASFPIGDQITVSFWTYGGDSLPKSNSAIEAMDANNRRILNIHLPWSNRVIYFDCGNNGSGFDRIEKIPAASDYKGKWSHWAFTKNASTGEMKIYLNGEQWQSGSGKTFTLPQATKFRLGSYCNGGSHYPGKINEVRIWNQARSQTEIAADMNRRLTGNETGLVAYWPLNDGDADIVLDKTPNENHGTIHGAEWVTDSELQLEPPPAPPPPEPNPLEELMLEPTTALCQNLWIYLDERRLLTTHHHVIGPEYVTVQIAATLHLQAGARPDAVRSQAVTSLKQFFDPLEGGSEGNGWPFGRNVYISEVYERLDRLSGVDYVENITLQGNTELRQVTLEEHQLVAVDLNENSFTIN